VKKKTKDFDVSSLAGGQGKHKFAMENLIYRRIVGSVREAIDQPFTTAPFGRYRRL
jgi:hypothetical protein